ncbi:hypothetical protein Q1695_004379 [Nippostrongylus brasiliensis]|nr:hypothetical protein Q1695_004379 [Nippostrongylus brasiliensis]
MNEHYHNLMVGALDGNGKKALALADKLVVEVLNAEEQKLIPALKKALQAQLSAFVQVKADCFTVDDSFNETCGDIIFDVAFVAWELIVAITEVHPDSQKKAKVNEILPGIDEYTRGKPGFENKIHALGKEVLAAI